MLKEFLVCVKQGINVNSKCPSYIKERPGANTLMLAALKGNLQICHLLLEMRQIDINETDLNGQNVLHYAARSTNLDLLRLLVNQNCDLLKPDIYGTLPLHAPLRYSGVSIKLSEQSPDVMTL